MIVELNNGITALELTGPGQEVSAGSEIPFTVQITTMDGEVRHCQLIRSLLAMLLTQAAHCCVCGDLEGL